MIRIIRGGGQIGDTTRIRRFLIVLALLLLGAAPARAGWVLERVSRTEGGEGPSSTVTLYVARGRVKELHPDGTYFLWDLAKGTLYRVDPQAKTYSGGPVKSMVAEIRNYLDDLRRRLGQLTDEQREELARRTEGLPMPVPPPGKPPVWTVKARERTARIAGHEARLYEVYRDGRLAEERWIAASADFGSDLDYPKYARWSRELESSFAAGMGGSFPEGAEIDALCDKGVELRSVFLGDKVRVVTEVTRLEKRDVPDSTFQLPADYILKGAQVS